MSYKRTTRDVYAIQGDYGYGDGFETVTTVESRSEAFERIREYRDNESRIARFRIFKTRERIEAQA
jgi:hypothetical protein